MPNLHRINSLDLLKLLSSLVVILIHANTELFISFGEIPFSTWLVSLVVASTTHWAVPVFFAVSGGVTLTSKKQSDQNFIKKRVAQLGIPLFFWTIFYAFFYSWYRGDPLSIDRTINRFLFDQPYEHLYFLVVLLLFLPLWPFLRNITKKLSGVSLLILSTLFFLLALRYNLSRNILFYPWPYLGYFLLGAGLVKLKLDSFGKNTVLPKLLGILLVTQVLAITLLTYFASVSSTSFKNTYFLSHINPLSMSLTAIILSLSLFSEKWLIKQKKTLVIMKHFLPSILGVYLVHPFIMDLIRVLNPWTIHNPTHIAFNFISTVLLSYPLILLIKRIPLLKRVV